LPTLNQFSALPVEHLRNIEDKIILFSVCNKKARIFFKNKFHIDFSLSKIVKGKV
jgi:hypothetical protein